MVTLRRHAEPHEAWFASPQQQPPTGGLAVAEVKHLWWFLDGAIMTPDVRHHLWRSWGLCPRHAWAYAAVEIELRGGRPFSVAILYEDLVRRAAKVLDKAWLLPWPYAARRLRSRAICFTCDYLSLQQTTLRYHEPIFEEYCSRVNRLERIRTTLAESQAIWEGRSCPLCLGGQGIPCRPHLLSGAGPAKGTASLADSLRSLGNRLGRFIDSMSWNGPVATPEIKVAWVEALGWFAGWDMPARLTTGQSWSDAPVSQDRSGASGRD
jgi:hypothetical protein